ncbi:MAG: YciI family protein [Vicinamibacterales bacterium]
MSKYMLVLHETPRDFAQMSPEDMQHIIARYRAWAKGLADKGQLVSGHKLREEGGKVLSKRDGSLRVSDGPYAEAKEVVGGFFIVEAADYSEAVALASACPHAQYGRIEVREVQPT